MMLARVAFISLLLLTLVTRIATIADVEDDENETEENDMIPYESLPQDQDHDHDTVTETEESFPLSGVGRSLLQRKHHRRHRLTCKKAPRICHAKGSPGPHCCKKKCVNLVADRLNCGKCGKKCRYNQICCKGKCVNPSFDKRHCGGCNNRCKKGEFCVFGLCNYA